MSGYNRTHIRGLYDYFGVGYIGRFETKRYRSKSPKRGKSPPKKANNQQNNEYPQNQKDDYSDDSYEVSYNEFADDDYYSDDYQYEEDFYEEESSYFNNRNLSSYSEKEENEDERVDFIICKNRKRLLDTYFNKWLKRMTLKETIRFQKNRIKKQQEKENPPKAYNTEDEYNLTNTDIQGCDDSQKENDHENEKNRVIQKDEKKDDRRKHRSTIVTIRSALCYGKMVRGIRSVSFKEYCVKKISKAKK